MGSLEMVFPKSEIYMCSIYRQERVDVIRLTNIIRSLNSFMDGDYQRNKTSLNYTWALLTTQSGVINIYFLKDDNTVLHLDKDDTEA